MADIVQIGKIYLNLDYVRQIFEDQQKPGTWNVFLEMGVEKGGAKIIQGMVFEGEEAQALEFYLANFHRNLVAEYRQANAPVEMSGREGRRLFLEAKERAADE